MGKKKAAKQNQEGLLQEATKIESAVSQAAGARVSKRAVAGRVYIKSSYNNTIVSVTDEKGKVLFWASAGSIGFTGPKKATPFAASKVVAALSEKLKKAGMQAISIYVTGVAGGRDSAIRSLVNQGFDIISIHDVTPVAHNGPRPKKERRV